MSPKDKKKLKKLRINLDKLDNLLISLIKKRTELVINHSMVKPHVTILKNSNKKDLSNNVKLICENLRSKYG